MIIKIENTITDTCKEVWSFTMIDLHIVFTAWHQEIKPIGKRKWTITNFWDNYNTRQSTVQEPILPDAIKEKAHQKACDLVKVKTWQEYKN